MTEQTTVAIGTAELIAALEADAASFTLVDNSPDEDSQADIHTVSIERAAAKALRAFSSWHPIATAPRTGVPILLWVRHIHALAQPNSDKWQGPVVGRWSLQERRFVWLGTVNGAMIEAYEWAMIPRHPSEARLVKAAPA